MLKYIFIFLLLCLFSIDSPAQSGSDAPVKVLPADFKSDGCSLFPDGDYRNCCVEHDRAYFFGGSLRQRRRADNELFKCVAATRGFQHKILASVMWIGVRAGGVSFLPTPFRWGFGRKKTACVRPRNCRKRTI